MERFPTGTVKFKIGNMVDLPSDCEEIKLFMREGDSAIYIVPVGNIPYSYEIVKETKITGDS